MNRFGVLIFLVVGLSQTIVAQLFIFNQLFQPSVRLNVEYMPDGSRWLGNAPDRLEYGRANMNLIIPVSQKMNMKVDWWAAVGKVPKLRQLRFKDIGDVAQLRMRQIFWNVRPQVSYFQYNTTDSLGAPFRSPQQAYGVSTGITGVHLLRKFRLLFYSVNAGFMEDANSVRRIHPNFTTVVGVANINRLAYYWYYGVYINYSNGRVLPAPFLGIGANLMNKLWLDITLPVQMRLGWQVSKRTKFDFVAGISGFNSGFGYQTSGSTDWQRSFYSGYQVRTSLVWNWRIGNQTKIYLEGGYLPIRNLSFGRGSDNFYQPTLQPSFYGGVSLYYSFKKSLLGSVIDGLITF